MDVLRVSFRRLPAWLTAWLTVSSGLLTELERGVNQLLRCVAIPRNMTFLTEWRSGEQAGQPLLLPQEAVMGVLSYAYSDQNPLHIVQRSFCCLTAFRVQL